MQMLWLKLRMCDNSSLSNLQGPVDSESTCTNVPGDNLMPSNTDIRTFGPAVQFVPRCNKP